MPADSIYREKLAQAGQVLAAQDIAMWLLFVRETGTLSDPSLPLLCDLSFTWETVVAITPDGNHAVLAGLHDCDSVHESGLFAEVIPYTEGLSGPLRDFLGRRDPARIVLNYSPHDSAADGLTYGMWLRLNEMLAPTPYQARLESADGLVNTLRATKTPGELFRMRAALRDAEDIFNRTAAYIKIGRSERDVAGFMHSELDRRKLWTSWEREYCPIVNTGPQSPVGHARPTDLRVEPGHLVHIDFGVNKNAYCTDQQRMWYVRKPGEQAAPAEVQRAFDTVVGAIHAAATILRPGMAGWEVDAIARRFVTDAGYPEYPHALGHTVGRTTHDGGTLLGPRWERYGTTPEGTVAPGQVYTLELGVSTPAGYCGIEEQVLITENGCEFLSPPQMELKYV